MEGMKELFTVASEHAILVVEALALVIIVFAAVEAFIKGLRAMFSPPTSSNPPSRRAGSRLRGSVRSRSFGRS